MFGWITNGGGINRYFTDTKLPDLVLRSEQGSGNVVLGNQRQLGIGAAALYIQNNQVGIGGLPEADLDVYGSVNFRQGLAFKDLNVGSGAFTVNPTSISAGIATHGKDGFRNLKGTIDAHIIEYAKAANCITISGAFEPFVRAYDWITLKVAGQSQVSTSVQVVAVTQSDAYTIQVYVDAASPLYASFHDIALLAKESHAQVLISVYTPLVDSVTMNTTAFVPLLCLNHTIDDVTLGQQTTTFTVQVLDSTFESYLFDPAYTTCIAALSSTDFSNMERPLLRLLGTQVVDTNGARALTITASLIDTIVGISPIPAHTLILFYPLKSPSFQTASVVDTNALFSMRPASSKSTRRLISVRTQANSLTGTAYQSSVRGMTSARIITTTNKENELPVDYFVYDSINNQLVLAVAKNMRLKFPFAGVATITYYFSGIPVVLSATSAVSSNTFKYTFLSDANSQLLLEYINGYIYIFGNTASDSGAFNVLRAISNANNTVAVYIKTTHAEQVRTSINNSSGQPIYIIPFKPNIITNAFPVPSQSSTSGIVFPQGINIGTNGLRDQDALTVDGAVSIGQQLSIFPLNSTSNDVALITHDASIDPVTNEVQYTISDVNGPRLTISPDSIGMTGAVTIDQSVTADEFRSPSDIKLKTNILQVCPNTDLEKLLQIDIPCFSFKNNPKRVTRGVIAQQLEQIVPEAVKTNRDFCADVCQHADFTDLSGSKLVLKLVHDSDLILTPNTLVKLSYHGHNYIVMITHASTDTTVQQLTIDPPIKGVQPHDFCFVIGTYSEYKSVDYNVLFCMCLNSLKALCALIEYNNT